nr:hypothetical protein Iba_chr13eCG12250 [Ipomoea batatas]
MESDLKKIVFANHEAGEVPGKSACEKEKNTITDKADDTSMMLGMSLNLESRNVSVPSMNLSNNVSLVTGYFSICRTLYQKRYTSQNNDHDIQLELGISAFDLERCPNGIVFSNSEKSFFFHLNQFLERISTICVTRHFAEFDDVLRSRISHVEAILQYCNYQLKLNPYYSTCDGVHKGLSSMDREFNKLTVCSILPMKPLPGEHKISLRLPPAETNLTPGLSWGSRLYISTNMPRMTRKRWRQYSWPIEFTPRWYTQPEYSTGAFPAPAEPGPPPLKSAPLSDEPLSFPTFLNIDPEAIEE